MTPEKQFLLVESLKRFGSSIVETAVFKGEVAHVIRKDSLLPVCNHLKNDPSLNMNLLVDVLGVDHYPEKPRFEVVYHLLSLSNRLRLRLKVRIDEGETIPTLTSIWKSADWAEREAYDMFGIIFEGHPNLKRIYMPSDWEG
ncbi:MAG: NADH-quinone oxidoreductase subunit C, partial [Deltaproteobacteria bacterium]|nr:NADH-quinone oxidoreductase subunit C [Deltaproteobacteria bacterium]